MIAAILLDCVSEIIAKRRMGDLVSFEFRARGEGQLFQRIGKRIERDAGELAPVEGIASQDIAKHRGQFAPLKRAQVGSVEAFLLGGEIGCVAVRHASEE